MVCLSVTSYFVKVVVNVDIFFFLFTVFRFENHSILFVALVVITGGSHSAMAVVSSNCFGLNLLSSGLTKYETRKLLKIKIINSVVLENMPQVKTLRKMLTNLQNLRKL